jgi:hypothetical protein
MQFCQKGQKKYFGSWLTTNAANEKKCNVKVLAIKNRSILLLPHERSQLGKIQN